MVELNNGPYTLTMHLLDSPIGLQGLNVFCFVTYSNRDHFLFLSESAPTAVPELSENDIYVEERITEV